MRCKKSLSKKLTGKKIPRARNYQTTRPYRCLDLPEVRIKGSAAGSRRFWRPATSRPQGVLLSRNIKLPSYLVESTGISLTEAVYRVLTNCMIHKVLALGEPQNLRYVILHVHSGRLEVVRRNFSYFGPKVFNDLLKNLTSSSNHSFNSFKL
ncbi:hypothetical protein J6590_005006 [Homalodisca vitripennis]|nr:hypothetical protein J6590_005006 [Homalodisca vitripennis]